METELQSMDGSQPRTPRTPSRSSVSKPQHISLATGEAIDMAASPSPHAVVAIDLPQARTLPPTPSQYWRGMVRRHRGVIIFLFLSLVLLLTLSLYAWDHLPWRAWIAASTTILVILGLVRSIADPDIIMFAGASVLLLFDVITPEQAFQGFSNGSVVSVALLTMVAAGVEEGGSLDLVVKHVLGIPKSLTGALLRMGGIVSLWSAFLNNTPVVLLFIPIVQTWSRRTNIPVSKLLIPLSFFSIASGVCTLIGTSTNLVIYGLAQERFPEFSLNLFEVGIVGLPMLLIISAYILFAGPRFLPVRSSASTEYSRRPREYSTSVIVREKSPIDGLTVEQAGLRHLPYLFLFSIVRARTHETLAAPDANTRIFGGDKLLFTGIVDSVRDLYQIDGLEPDHDDSDDEDDGGDRKDARNKDDSNKADSSGGSDDNEEAGSVPRSGQRSRSNSQDKSRRRKRPSNTSEVLVEVVIGNGSLVGKTVRAARFRSAYGAAIVAVHRHGERVISKVGDIVLQPGDTLLLNTTETFLERFKYDAQFALVSPLAASASASPGVRDQKKLIISVVGMLGLIIANAADLLDLEAAALAVLMLFFATGVMTVQRARRAFNASIIGTIAGAFALAEGLEVTGVASEIGQALVDLFKPMGPYGILLAIYLATTGMSLVISNAAAAALVFPIALAARDAVSLSLKAIVLDIMMGASASFATPISYQTNLMVLGPGGYSFGDFVKFGMPLQLISAVCVPLLIHLLV